MAYTAGNFDQNHLYVQWGGMLPGNEVWSCGLRMVASSPDSIAASDATLLSGLVSAITAFHTRSTTMISTRAVLQYVKANAVGVNGKYLYPTTQQSILANTNGGASAANTLPNQVALAISLTTGVGRGPAHRGRFYIPLPAILPQSDGLIDATVRDGIKTSATTFLTALNAITPNFQVGVFSRKSGAATHKLVTGIAVGRVLDTQRRRRNKLIETY